MNSKDIKRLQLLEQLIKDEKTGDRVSLSEKLNITTRHVYRLLNQIRDYGVDVDYDKTIGSFVYTSSKRLQIHYSLEVVDAEECKKIEGGQLDSSLFNILSFKLF